MISRPMLDEQVGYTFENALMNPLPRLLSRLLKLSSPTRRPVRAWAEGFSWDDTTNGQLELFRKILGANDRQGSVNSA